MRIGLIDVDGHNFPNLPLMKLSAWSKSRGAAVEWYDPLDGSVNPYDFVHLSKVFTDTPDYDAPIYADRYIRGGTGYESPVRLPPEIESAYPDYGLYGNRFANTAFGFLTRGCPRCCDFCIVSNKEGRTSRQVADLGQFWRGQRFVKLLDPNLLACSEHEALLGQLAASRARVDFTQGLDIRLTNPDNIRLIKACNIERLHFAWDNPREDLTTAFRRFKKLSGIADPRRLIVYVLTNFGSSHEEDLYRVYKLRELGYHPFVMIYDKPLAPEETVAIQRWVNNRKIFGTVERFEDYDAKRG